ncbi:MAG: hypothetical protein PHI19_03350, partial [Clostridia bacterium]|nr:hypothetical protein [Clostridia bacterium]
PIYYTETDYINASVETHTDKTIQMYAKINDISTLNIDGLQPTSSYNIWADNYILVNWYRSLDDNPNAEGFNFLEWQYYAYDGEGWSWQTLPDTDLADQNKPTNVTYQFSVASLIQNSYINHTMSPIDVSMYNEDNEFTGTEPIFTIKIRPLFQRKENINIQKVVYTEAYGIPNEEAAVYGPASIEDSGNTFGTYNFYDIVTLKPGSRSGFRFLGWYYSATGLENDYILVTHADASGEMTATRDYQLINYQEGSYGGDLRVRLTKDTVVKAVYIRIWNITVKVYNDSGSTAHMTDSAPNLDYYGVARLENGLYVYNTTPTQAMGRSQSLIMQAGEMAKFMMSFTGTGFNSDYDRYYSTNVIVEGVTQNWSDTIEASRSENMPVKGESSTTVLDDATLIVTANQSKTIELVFRSYGKLQIDNIYPESAVVLPTQFYDAMVANATNNNWNENLVIDNGPIDEDSRTGYVLISDIPIKKEASSTYDGIFKNKLPQMDGAYAFTPISVSSFNINFSGAVIGGTYAKLQSFTYYNTTAGGSDGMSKMDMPFYVDGTTYGNGTLATPYKISTVNHLKSIDTFIASRGNTAAGVYFMLNNSIDVTSLFTGASPYNGIGKDIPFDGIFDGNGKNLYFGENVGIGAIPNFGIFRQTDAATIRNIKIGYSHTISLTANSSSIAGYLVGTANNSLIEDITTSTGRISIVGRSTVGGIVGRATGNTIIQDCIITCQMGVQAVEDSIGIVGGIAGALNNTSLVRNINIDGILQLTAKRYIGAIAGKVDGDTSTAIDNCQTYLPRVADISYQAIGGIVGYNGANRGVEDCSIKSESTAMTFYSGTFTTFNSSTLSKYGTAGGGLIAGINLGTLKNCNINNLPSIKMVGAFCGGIVGVNTGRVDDCDSASVYITTEKNMANSGGTYGAIVGYNIGEIRNANINGAANNTMNFTNCNYAIKSHTYSPSPFQTSGVNPSVVTPVSDGGYIYLGGFAGYNGSGGKIVSCVATGAKMLINRWARNDTNNYTYNGILAGYNNSGNSSSTGNSITNSSALIYACVAVDNGSASTNGSTSYNYLGDIYGYNTSGGVYSSGSGNRLRLTVVGIGSVFTNWVIYATSQWTTNDKRGVNGRDYRTGKIHYAITSSSGSTQYFVRQCDTTDLHSLSGRETATNYYWTGSWLSLRLRSETIYRYPLYLRYLNIV